MELGRLVGMIRNPEFAVFCLIALNSIGTEGFLLSKSAILKTHRTSQNSALALRSTDDSVGWWDAPKRIVEIDGGLRARGLKYWLMDEHNVDLSKLELKVSPLEGLGVFAAKDLSPGEELFTIPRSCCIYPELVLEDRQLGKTMKQLASRAGTGIEVSPSLRTDRQIYQPSAPRLNASAHHKPLNHPAKCFHHIYPTHPARVRHFPPTKCGGARDFMGSSCRAQAP
jgi:hypothetical protein